ncbi:MAG: hypothetical protein IPJ19_00945 [Planctomycetes bacterium]|nr:hypothetical protein [Planctomycetota bacterium]
MLRILVLSFCALALPGATVEDGAAWVKDAEAKLYCWPAPHATVRFQVHTDALAPLIDAMKQDLEKKPDAAGARFVAALEKLEISGSIDTATGKYDTEIKIDLDESDARAKAAAQTVRQRLRATIGGCFASLPLQDPALLRKGAAVSSAEETTDEHVVTSNGMHPGDTTVLHISRESGLPRQIELPRMTIGIAYAEATRGHFVPASLDLDSKMAPASHAEFSWQHEGEVWFPEHVRLSAKGAQAKIDFDHLVIEPHKP